MSGFKAEVFKLSKSEGVSSLIVGCALVLSGCTALFEPPLPDDRYRLACGQQCLTNGEDCSHFFALKNEERRLSFEQAKSNYWLCTRRYADSRSESPNPCIAPGPQPEAYDHCGDDLGKCLSACPVTLEELPGLHGAGSSKAIGSAPSAGSPAESGTLAPAEGLSVFK